MADESFDIDYIARLAHGELTDAEKAAFGKQLGDVLAYMEKLKSLDVDGVEPTMHGHGRPWTRERLPRGCSHALP